MRRIAILNKKFSLENCILMLTVGAILSACSTPRYTYYFSKYAIQNNVSAETSDVKDVDSMFVSKNRSREFSLLQVQKESLGRDASIKSVVPENVSVIELHKNKHTAFTRVIASGKNETMKKLLLPNKAHVITDDGAKNGNKKKNGFAITGFILSIAGLLLFVVEPVALVLSVFGVLFSLIGFKSEKRKLAIAGLIIGVVGFGIALLYGVLSGLDCST